MKVANATFFALVEEQLAAGRSVQIPLVGHSMEPTLHPGDTMTVAPLRDAPTVGDVVLFRYHGTWLLHRVVDVLPGGLLMQGDNAYLTEQPRLSDCLATLVEVQRRDGRRLTVPSNEWRRLSRRALARKRVRNFAVRWLGRGGRRQLRPWYFALLAVLMWAPLNGLGVPLDNYILGLRLDHLLHASVYLLCPLFLMDLFDRRKGLCTWLAAVGIGLLTEGVQYLLPYRGFDINDLVANTLGVTLGLAALIFAMKYIRRYKSAG